MRKILITKSGLMPALLLVGTISCSPLSGPTRLTTASGTLLKLCDGISTQFNHPNTRLESMQPQAAGVLKLAGKDIPAHCLVKGKMNERKGSDGRDYAVAFEMRLPDLSTAFNEAERRAVGQATIQQCDALDGAVDGMVQATQACQTTFRLDRLPTCAAGALTRDGTCLSSAQKQALAAVQTGFQNDQGKPFYMNFPWDPGIARRNWAQWKFVNAMALDPGAIGSVFAVPPLAVDSLRSDVQDLAARSLSASDGTRESGMGLMSPPGHETGASLDALWKRGAKMVIYHGVSDAIFSAEDTRQW